MNNSQNPNFTQKAVVRKPAPQFTACAWANNKLTKINLSDYKGMWVVLFFYPLDFTFVCPTEICNFSDAYKTFQEINTEVIGISTDSAYSHREWALKPRKQGGLAPLSCPLISDQSQEISKDYGVLIDDGEDKGMALRGTFIIDPNGILKHSSINDLDVGRSIDEVLRLVQAFQFVDKHGEVCPAKWQPGKKSMGTDHDDPKLKQFWEDELSKDH